MTTTIVPKAPAPGPAPQDTIRFVAIRANLLPEEVVDARRTHAMVRASALGLAGLLVVLVGWYGVTMWQTSRAKDSLAGVQRTSDALRNQERTFSPLVTAQSQAASIKAELTMLMAGDLQWKDLLATLRKSAKGGVTITSVTGTTSSDVVAAARAGAGGLAILNQSGKQEIGTLTVSGTAPDKNAVAAYIDTLTKVAGLAAPFPANVIAQGGKVTFSASVIITSDALGGRYATPATGGH